MFYFLVMDIYDSTDRECGTVEKWGQGRMVIKKLEKSPLAKKT